MKTCKGCKYAEWVRTANGRLHPSGDGKCTFKLPLSPLVPGAVLNSYYGREAIKCWERMLGQPLRINRKDEFLYHCKTFAREQP